MSDPINPDYYRNHPSGVECITVTEHMNFCIGSAMGYLWRAGQKGDAIQDLKKARWFIDREIARLSIGTKPPVGWKAVVKDHNCDHPHP